MKNKGIDNCQDIRQYCRRHIGQITFREEKGKKNIETDKSRITENGIPYPHQEKAPFCLMGKPKLFPGFDQKFTPWGLIEVDAFLFYNQRPFLYLSKDNSYVFSDNTQKK